MGSSDPEATLSRHPRRQSLLPLCRRRGTLDLTAARRRDQKRTRAPDQRIGDVARLCGACRAVAELGGLHIYARTGVWRRSRAPCIRRRARLRRGRSAQWHSSRAGTCGWLALRRPNARRRPASLSQRPGGQQADGGLASPVIRRELRGSVCRFEPGGSAPCHGEGHAPAALAATVRAGGSCRQRRPGFVQHRDHDRGRPELPTTAVHGSCS